MWSRCIQDENRTGGICNASRRDFWGCYLVVLDIFSSVVRNELCSFFYLEPPVAHPWQQHKANGRQEGKRAATYVYVYVCIGIPFNTREYGIFGLIVILLCGHCRVNLILTEYAFRALGLQNCVVINSDAFTRCSFWQLFRRFLKGTTFGAVGSPGHFFPPFNYISSC